MLEQDLKDRLLRLDEDANLLFADAPWFRVLIVGGSALILLGKIARATHDIDVVSAPMALYDLFDKYDINAKAEAYINNFPYNFEDRLIPIPLATQKIDFFTPSLEDLVIAKLCSARDTDAADVTAHGVLGTLNWKLLEYLALSDNEAKASALNERCYAEFLANYRDYVARYRPCGN